MVAPTDSTALAEKRLARLRDTAATVPQKEEVLKSVAADLAQREAGLIQADTAPQARRGPADSHTLVRSQQIQIERGAAGIAPLGDAYGGPPSR